MPRDRHGMLSELFDEERVRHQLNNLNFDRFPLHLVLIVDDHVDSVQFLTEMVIAARLRCKGYRLTVASSGTTTEERTRITQVIRRFFQSLGEANIAIVSEAPEQVRELGDMAIFTPKIAAGAHTVAFPDLREVQLSASSLTDRQRRYLQDQIVLPWYSITAFQRQGGVPNGSSAVNVNGSSDHNFAELHNDIGGRLNFSPDFPVAHLCPAAPRLERVKRDANASAMWSAIAAAGEEGITLHELAALTRGSYPLLLSALKALLAARLIFQVAERCYARSVVWDSALGADQDVSVDIREITPRAASIDLRIANPADRAETVAPNNVSVQCVFPTGLFGYHTDDPDKCSAVRMIQAKLAVLATTPSRGAVILDPTAECELTEKDFRCVQRNGICLLDTAWYMLPALSLVLENTRPDCPRRSLTLPQADSSYYTQSTRTPTAAAAAYVLSEVGERGHARAILDLFDWGDEWTTLIGL